MLVRKAVIDRLRIVILMAGMSLPLFAQPPAEGAPDLDGALARGQIEQARQALEAMLTRPHVELDMLLDTGGKLADRGDNLRWLAALRNVHRPNLCHAHGCLALRANAATLWDLRSAFFTS